MVTLKLENNNNTFYELARSNIRVQKISTGDTEVTKNSGAGGPRDVEMLLTSIIHVWRKYNFWRCHHIVSAILCCELSGGMVI
jgi:hypothetical protein